ncbi:M23 family metallopeptidase [Actimicrobium sp. CCC2.4]|uniref:M23 family metallopeptidase n=1 Tax=Actimicrobium sp. CCC2.4 TaxID=3048606 RepID=UPI002AC98DAC|nr:M23 family metallopeptidase [Actimicrobium sp. CCC2.4]MEB0135095.1 M23 family metallopeptidase [Actimicrobium sp. CCC2.4]WPX31858.1 M23 family metallopeptidase [Actimicrobium sp. CCC2.4]
MRPIELQSIKLAFVLFLFCCFAGAVRAAPEPVLEVVSFGLAGGRAGSPTAAAPQDFVYDGIPKADGRASTWSGPMLVAQNDTWQTILARLHAPADAWTSRLMQAATRDWPQRPVRGSKVWVEWSELHTPLAVFYSVSARQMRMATMIGGELRIREATKAGDEPPALSGGALYMAADTIGLPEEIVDQLVALFSGELDFHRDLTQGFKGTVLFEMQFNEGQIGRPGRILAARLVTPQRTHTAYLFDGAGTGERPYFSADGHPVQQTFLQSPIVFSRMTSGYSVARFHPILQAWRAHTGIDFAAPAGTPVRITADGVVEFAGVRGGYGNLVLIRHADDLSTYYGHLQGFSKGLKVGMAVRQGDLLGTVGMTGLATGPHLHYELRRLGRPFDPALLRSVQASLPANQLERFDHLVHWYETQLSASTRSHFVRR